MITVKYEAQPMAVKYEAQPMAEWEIANGIIVDEISAKEGLNIHIENSRIKSISDKTKDISRINLNGLYVYPGLINSHDHLLGSYLPKVGNNSPYLSWLAWDNDLKSSAVFAERQQLATEQLYLLGAYRHLLCGVTTIMDHIPHQINAPFIDTLPVKLIKNYKLSHSICSYSLGWGKNIKLEYADAERNNAPYVTHLAEGFDTESLESLALLENSEGLGSNSVLVHCLSFSDEDIRKIKQKNASVVWCPSSNLHIFKKTTDIKKFLDMGINVCLGTDNPLSGSLNIFAEIKIARDFFMQTYGEELPAKTIFKMLTTNAARALKVETSLGRIEAGKSADLLVLKNRFDDPWQNLCQAEMDDVRLVVIDGKPVYGDISLKSFFDLFGEDFEIIKIGSSEKIIKGSPGSLLESIYKTLGYKKNLAFLPIV